MEKERTTKTIAILALLLGVIGLSVGFAAFSNTLTIKSGATVTPDKDKLDVNFSNNEDGTGNDPIKPEKTPEDIEATDATIDNTTGNPVISNLSANFTAPGQKVEYNFYVNNSSEYVVYLKNILFANVPGETSSRVCRASEGATDALVQAACDDIVLSIKVGDEAPVTGSKPNIVNHTVAKGTSETIKVTIEYLPEGDISDGNFNVEFGDVSLEYRTAD